MLLHSYTANILVISKGRFSNKNYTYAIPTHLEKDIAINQLVNIVFNKRTVKGIVSGIHEFKPLNSSSMSEIISIDSMVDVNLINYFTHLSNYYCNPTGHTIKLHFELILSQINIQKNINITDPKYIYGKDCRNMLIENIDPSQLNIIYVPSLRSIKLLAEFLNDNNLIILFYQKTGGKQESSLMSRIINKNKSGIIISLNTSIFNPHMNKKNLLLHYWDINNYAYTESRMPKFNLIDVSNIQSIYTDHIQFYYSEFPDYRYVRSNDVIEISLPKLSVKYFHEHTIKDSLVTFLRTEPKLITTEATYNFEFCSTELKNELLNAANINDDEINIFKESNKISNVNVIIEPTISYINVLNSNRLARLIRYLNILKVSNSQLYVLTRRDHKFIDLLSMKNINNWLNDEFSYRNKYGPSHDTKLIQITSNNPIKIFSDKLSGPIIDQVTKNYTYQLTYTLEECLQNNYYEDLKKFEYSFINYL